LHDTITSFTI